MGQCLYVLSKNNKIYIYEALHSFVSRGQTIFIYKGLDKHNYDNDRDGINNDVKIKDSKFWDEINFKYKISEPS